MIHGVNLRDRTQESVRKAIGIVPQDTVMFNASIGYNIGYGRETATQEEIEEVMQARLDEIFEHIDKELGRVNRSGQLPGGVILAGGGSRLKGLEDYAKERLRLPVRIAKPTGFSGLSDKVDGSEFSTAVGLMLHDLAMNLDTSKGPRLNISTSGMWKGITNIVGNLKP